jgi:hypothetical protein
MQRWEYITFDLVKRKNEIEELNRLGQEGWEAVAMVSSWGVGWRFVHPSCCSSGRDDSTVSNRLGDRRD